MASRSMLQVNAAHLLEVGELRHLHPVQPDLPAQSPCPKGRRFPVVLDEPDVMLQGIDAEPDQAFKVQFLYILRMGLQDHLELIIVLHPVGVLAVTAIGRPARRLYIGGAPGLGTEYTQKGGWMEGTCTDLNIVGLMNDAALRSPVILQGQYKLLKCQIISSVRKTEKESECTEKIECYYTKKPYLVKQIWGYLEDL
jgi:hypothetical protein